MDQSNRHHVSPSFVAISLSFFSCSSCPVVRSFFYLLLSLIRKDILAVLYTTWADVCSVSIVSLCIRRSRLVGIRKMDCPTPQTGVAPPDDPESSSATRLMEEGFCRLEIKSNIEYFFYIFLSFEIVRQHRIIKPRKVQYKLCYGIFALITCSIDMFLCLCTGCGLSDELDTQGISFFGAISDFLAGQKGSGRSHKQCQILDGSQV